ncbi:MAG TPA: amidohydrolase [Thermoplasmata archaeon]|nr:amidohydrolase [Thermoplasmata archaeon]
MRSAHLWRNARVFTGRRYADALLVDQGRVVAVGTEAEVRRSAPTGTESEDLSGRLVLPGLIDSHLHLAELTHAREAVDLSSARSIRELVSLVRGWAAEHPLGVVVGFGWTADRLGRFAPPSRAELDEAVPDRPAVLQHVSRHAAVVNSPAIEALELGRESSDPPGGRIGRSPDGSPNGMFYESALRLLLPLTSTASRLHPDALARTIDRVVSFGLTTVATMNVGPGEHAALETLAKEGRLPVRVREYLHLDWVAQGTVPKQGPVGDVDDSRLVVLGVKGFTDGAFGPRTAWLSNPYADAPEESGLPTGASDEKLTEIFGRAVSLGLAPALHAIGDRAVGRTLQLLAPHIGTTRAPARIEHAALTPPELLSRLDEVRPALVVQPGFVWSDFWLGDRLGRERARWAYAFRTLADRGHLLAGSSDAPCDPLDPWRGLRAAVSRRDPEGRSANPDPSEALPAEEAVAMYTVHGGRVLGDPELGSLEPGARADLVVVDAPDLRRAFLGGAEIVREVWVDGAPRTGPKTEAQR